MTYARLGRLERALQIESDVYSGRLKLHGEAHGSTLLAANNYTVALFEAGRFEEAKSLLRKTLPVARRVLGDNDTTTLRMRMNYGWAFYKDDGATLDDLREAVMTLKETERTARRVLGGAHPLAEEIGDRLQEARAALGSREMTASGRGTTRAGDVRALREAVAAMSTSGTK